MMTEDERDNVLHTIVGKVGEIDALMARTEGLRGNLERYSNLLDIRANGVLSTIQADLNEHKKFATDERKQLTLEMRELKASLLGRRTETLALLAGSFALIAVVATLFFAVLDMHRTIAGALSRPEAPAVQAHTPAAPASQAPGTQAPAAPASPVPQTDAHP